MQKETYQKRFASNLFPKGSVGSKRLFFKKENPGKEKYKEKSGNSHPQR